MVRNAIPALRIRKNLVRMKRPILAKLLLLNLLFLLPGCPWPRRAPAFESFRSTRSERLEQHTARLLELETRVSSVESSINSMRKQLNNLEQKLLTTSQEDQTPPPRRIEQVAPRLEGVPECVVEAVEIGFLSVPYDKNDDGIDDGITVYVCPTDQDGETLKRVGQVKLDLIDLAPDPPATLMHWEFSTRETVKHWSSLPRGYLFNLPWQGGKPPEADQLYLKVTFIDLQGRSFTDERKFSLRLGKPKEN